MAAKTLRDKGMSQILLLEKDSRLGGKIATFRNGDAVWDCGAQFFTVRSPRLHAEVTEWLTRGWIKKWFGDPYPRYTSPTGMDRLIEFLSTGINTRFHARVDRIVQHEQGFECRLDTGESIPTRSVILTPPAPITQQILKKGNSPISQDMLYTLSSIVFQPSVVALLTLSQPSAVPAPGHIDQGLPEGIERIVDQQKKGISSLPTMAIYMKAEWADKNAQQPEDVIIQRVLELIKNMVPTHIIKRVHLAKWDHSQTNQPIKASYLEAGLAHPLLIAGDAFLQRDDHTGRTRFESAFLSGIAAGEKLYEYFRK